MTCYDILKRKGCDDMALITCSECGKEFSEHAECCPNCGCPVDVIREQIELANIKKEPETIEFAKHFKCEKCGCTEFNPMIATTCVIAQCANCGIATFNNVIRKQIFYLAALLNIESKHFPKFLLFTKSLKRTLIMSL